MASAPSTASVGTIPDETIRRLCELTTLPENWDSYGGRPIDPQSVAGALRLLLDGMQEDTPAPEIVPTNRSRVLLEWHTRGIDLEIEVLSPRRFYVNYEDPSKAIEWEREIGPDLSPLTDPVARLSE